MMPKSTTMTPKYDFSDQVAFVTGAARGIGRELAFTYAEHGADIVAMDLGSNRDTVPYDLGTPDEFEEVVEGVRALDQRVVAVEGDVSVETDVKRAVETAIEELDRIDILANNAGIDSTCELIKMDVETWNEMMEINLKGVWLCAKHVGRHMIERSEGGKIVSTSSILGLAGAPRWGHYVAAKHGVVGLTKTLALELAEHDINVNAVAPTNVDTPMVTQSMDESYSESFMSDVKKLTGSWNVFDDGMIEPRDVCAAYMWLSSDAARYVTGITLPVDAGMLAK